MYAVHRQFDAHEAARAWLDEQLNGTDRVALPWGVLLAFLRLSANSHVLSAPLSFRDASAVVSAWLGLPVTWTPEPTDDHARLVGELLAPETKPDLVPDAHLAALAIEHGLTLHSTDRDFARFPGLLWTDPLR